MKRLGLVEIPPPDEPGEPKPRWAFRSDDPPTVEDMRENRAAFIAWKATRAGRPTRFAGASLSDFPNPPTSRRSPILIRGAVGVGKTHLAAALFHDRMLRELERGVEHLSVLTFDWQSIPALAVSIQSSYREDGGPAAALRYPTRASVLVLDDLGAEKLTEDWLSKLGLLIDERYANDRETIVTTNLSLDEIATTYDDRIASRLSSGSTIALKGKDRRGS